MEKMLDGLQVFIWCFLGVVKFEFSPKNGAKITESIEMVIKTGLTWASNAIKTNTSKQNNGKQKYL